MSSDDENKVGGSVIVVLGAIFAFMGILILITIFQIYIRYCLRNQQRRRTVIRFQLRIAGVSPTEPNLGEDQPPITGLDQSVIASLPKFVYKASHRPSHGEETECSVCLSTILEEAIVRVLPNCKHLFHADCIDMWLNSHSTCPICRALAEPRPEAQVDVLGAMVQQPTAPPLEGGSASRLSSFRRMLSRERSSRRIQSCGEEEEVGAAEDIERH